MRVPSLVHSGRVSSRSILTAIVVVVVIAIVVQSIVSLQAASRSKSDDSQLSSLTSSLSSSTSLESTETQSITSTRSQTLLTACETNFNESLPLVETESNSSIALQAFVMKPGSVSALCVTYSVSSSERNLTANMFSASIINANATCTGEYNCIYYPYNAQNIQILSDAGSSDLTNMNSSKITVVYTIVASQNATGYYSLSFPNQCPSLIPFAIAESPQLVNASEFVGYFAPSSCPIVSAVGQPEFTGYTNLNVVWLSG